MQTFSERIKKLRNKSGIKQIDMANHIGISIQSYSSYELGREPKYNMLCDIAKYFNVTTDYLLGMPDTEQRIVEVKQPLLAYSDDELLAEVQRRMKG